ncbi:SnoaL-like domain-containing protein [Xinfangfangia sp. D13-10-4-6]|uniref:nuclear transport factor 2 family protein n=1 Tax=Pseudogemmobacter hezensis TaxID=2737662 RepID=UPI0015521A9B|nr:nuclear transport factor 2 family protein [Pseudogemmobacter hezensis]NPD14782.1 SnoaL-like domain-containing protein [Pseudogemmobacter hezensis]
MIKALKAAAIGATLALGAIPALAETRDLAQEEANRQLVVGFYDKFFNDHDISAADVVAEGYIQHNPHVPDGKAPFVGYFTGFFAENPQSKAKIVRSAADGDLVWIHVHSTNGESDAGQAIVDIFRVEDGKIIEHWDVIQDVPAEAANQNTMF